MAEMRRHDVASAMISPSFSGPAIDIERFRPRAAATAWQASNPDLDIGSRRVAEHLHFLARLARRNASVVLALDPLLPMRPPRSRVFRRLGDPVLEIADRPGAGPVLVFLRGRRIDDAGDVAGAGHHIVDLS